MSLDRVVGEHEFYCCGARILLRRGEIKVLSEPRIVYCPLLESMYGVREVDVETVKRIVEEKVRGFGFCCGCRLFDSSMAVPYGSSEIISVCIDLGLIDCGVVVCDGAGTVITSNPKLIQGIGARLTGIIRTSPVDSTINYIRSMGGIVLDESTARIDQAGGVAKAIELGYRRIAVTVAGFDSSSIEAIRHIESERGVEVAVFSVCNTCASKEDAMRIASGADVVCASASRLIREIVGSKAVMQLGVAIPVYALTRLGKKLLLSYLTVFEDRIVVFRVHSLPYIVEGRMPIAKE
ncbi:MAG: DUF2099 family protein [Nitrososphaerota archaeon]|nr:DUF2099 family protein [Candidatus Bathyarchaeota archaeon]MDW8061945.1 DUF2099 family protein [Nitrososphaerota archaeon]